MGESADELWEAYRRCAVLRRHVLDAALRSVPRPKLMEVAGRLGLPVEDEMAQLAEEDLAYVFDLAVYAAPPGRSRAVDRVVQQQGRSAEGEATLVLQALAGAWFSVFRVVGAHPEAGLVLEDALLGGEVWVLEESLAETASSGTVLATRLGRVRGFALTCGAVAVLDEAVLAGFRRVMVTSGVAPEDMAADPRFVTLVYQRALGFRLDGGTGPG